MSSARPTRPALRETRAEPGRGRAAAARATGVLLYVIAFATAFAGGIGGAAGGAAAVVVALVLAWVAARLFLRAKRQAAPTAELLLARDHRPPVVYLRSFTADRLAGKGVTNTSWFTEEEQLARVMRDVGPLVAIGAPGESLPELGAARLYVGNDWREVVHSLTTRSRIVIVRLGRSAGSLWELENVLRWVGPEQIVLLVPRDEQLYDELRSRSLVPRGLPPLPARGRRRLFRGSLRAVITFDRAWTPTLTDLQAISVPLLRRSPAYPLVPVLTLAFGPLFRRMGLPGTAPGHSGRMIVTILALVVLFWGLYALYS